MNRHWTKALWVVTAATMVWGCVTLVVSSDGLSLLEFLLVVYGGLAFGGLAVVIGSVLLVLGLKGHRRSAGIFPAPFLVQFACLVVVFFGVSFGLAFDARLLMSSSALESAAAQLRSVEEVKTPQWIGLFKVREIDATGGSVRFVVGDSGLDEIGVAHSESGQPTVVGEDAYDHLHGPWWVWERSW